MPDYQFDFSQIATFARAMKIAAPDHLLRSMGRAFFLIGKSDIEMMKQTQLSGGRLNIRSKRFANAFKSRATDTRRIESIDKLVLSEYTGAKPFRIFETGGEIEPRQSRTLTILAPGGRTASGQRKYTQKELRDLVASGVLKIIQTKSGAAIVKAEDRLNKKGASRIGSKVTIIAWLRPRVHETHRIDFLGNFQANAGEHERLLAEAGERAIDQTIAQEGES